MQSGKSSGRVVLILILLSFLTLPLGMGCHNLSAELRGLWVTAWDMTTPEKIDSLLTFAQENNITQIFAHIRYRGDALYKPNRYFDTFPNPEPVSYILANNPDFDPFAYLIKQAEKTDIEIHAWVTVFVTTPRVLDNLSTDHLYYRNRQWFTRNFMSIEMAYDSYEGAYLDPGIPAVHDYLINVFLDIINNYRFKGFQLDYIRYPDSQFGYAPLAVENFSNSGKEDREFHQWREEQITRFVRRFYAEAKHRNPDLVISAAVISNLDRALNRYSQNWLSWLEEGIIDYAYTMAYALEDHIIEEELASYRDYKDRIVVGLRAWSDERNPYNTEQVLSKIAITRREQFAGYALFSYTGIQAKDNKLLWQRTDASTSVSSSLPKNKIFGYLTDSDESPLPRKPVFLNSDSNNSIAITDENGFFQFSDLKPGDYWLTSERGINVIFSGSMTIPSGIESNIKKYRLRFSSGS